MPIKAEQLEASLGKGLRPIYLIAGAEPLLVQECRDAVRQAAVAQGFLQREIIHVDSKFDWQSLTATGNELSLFAERRIIDLRLPTGKPGRDGAAVLTAWAADLDPDKLLIVSCEAWDKSSRNAKWSSTLGKAGVLVEIWPVKAGELPRWIGQRMSRVGLKPDREAVMILVDRLEGNLLAAQQEIEKLALLKGQGKVTAQDVLQSVADSSRFDAFLLAENMLAGNLAASLRVSTGLRRTGIPIQLVSGALVRDLRILEAFRHAVQSGADEAGVFRKFNIWYARQAPLRHAAGRVNQQKLNAAMCSLALIDRQGKGRAAGDPWHELDHMLCAFCA